MKYMDKKRRRLNLLDVATELALESGFHSVNRVRVGNRAGVAPSLISTYFKNIEGLKTAVMHRAILKGHYTILAQGILDSHPAAISAPSFLKTLALDSLK